MNEREIIKGCIKGDRRSQNALYKSYFPLMSSIVQRYSKADELIEIVNKGFLKVLDNIDKYDSTYSLATWIRTILIRTIIDEQRKENHQPVHVELGDYDGVVSINSALSRLNQNDLLDMLKTLPPMSRRVFNLFAIDGFAHAEIAEILGMSEGTSKWHLAEARKKLKAEWERRTDFEKKREVLRNEA